MVTTIPARFTDKMSKHARKGKVYLEYLRNRRGATPVAAYSTGTKPRALLAVSPALLGELTPALRSDQFTFHNIEERLSISGNDDLWNWYHELNQNLTRGIMRLSPNHPVDGGL